VDEQRNLPIETNIAKITESRKGRRMLIVRLVGKPWQLMIITL
jgi:hypothetical protein